MPLVKAIVKERSRDEWLKRLDKAGVPSGAIRTVGEVCDSELLSRLMVADYAAPQRRRRQTIKSAMHLSQTPLEPMCPPRLGEYREILTASSVSAATTNTSAQGSARRRSPSRNGHGRPVEQQGRVGQPRAAARL